MNLQGIVAVSGKPGLWRALAQNKTGYILESLDTNKTKLVANLATAKIAALHEITIFGEDEDLKLVDILEGMKSASAIPDAKADGKKLREFFREVALGHDEEKVYSSDIKKVINWFQILKDFPFFNEKEAVEPPPDVDSEKAKPPVEESAITQDAKITELAAEVAITETPVIEKTKKTVKAKADVEETEPNTEKPKAKKPAAKKGDTPA